MIKRFYLLICVLATFIVKADNTLWLSSLLPDYSQRIDIDANLGPEGYRICRDADGLCISAETARGLMYGRYALQRMAACGQLDTLHAFTSVPAYGLRILNHWDNLDGTVERGYAGHSIWQWDELPQTISPRYRQYAEACASVGINGAVLNNVNASPTILSDEYITKVAAIADVLRLYGVRVYLSVNFASPMVLSGLPTADPLNADVAAWWQRKVDSIYSKIPDFGGFLVKANSEGQPGPCDYGRTHAQGANMLARALAPHNGIVMWRAFVYSPSDADRAKQAYLEFNPLDGQFDDNVIVQIKNGPIDFQPREPVSPLFFGLSHTNMMAELQITQEYLGHANHTVFLAPLWREFFDAIGVQFIAPTPAWPQTSAPNSRIPLKGVAGVANIGDDENWTGNPLAQANWYAFGRLAWNPQLTSEQIAHEWAKQTFNPAAVSSLPDSLERAFVEMLCGTREAAVNYMMPIGLHHIFAWGHHYGPEPWCDISGARPDWMPSYYHRADSIGIGFDRSSSGSNAVAQYPQQLAQKFDNIKTCPDEYLLWFHHATWTHTMHSGRTLWEELCYRYNSGIQYVQKVMIPTWQAMKPYVSASLYDDITVRLNTQLRDAFWWRDACLQYFAQFSHQPMTLTSVPTSVLTSVPTSATTSTSVVGSTSVEGPRHTLTELESIHLPITNFESPSPVLLNSLR